jgi:glyoxylase-like metal-dependent hydrolase (beta-lactamase superfamily II)
MEYRIISIGAMSAHPLWNERAGVRSGHATTTLIATGSRRILVDPSLPAQLLVAKLQERANLLPRDITDVFLTSFNPECRRGLAVFESARWWVSEKEREAVGVQLASALKELVTRTSAQGGVMKDAGLRDVLEQDVAQLRRCEPSPQSLGERVDLFPLGGVSPGLCGLVLAGARLTTVICGDAIPTQEHLEQGKVLACDDLEQARASFEEALEVADLLVLGRDNLTVNPTKRPF